MEVENDNTTTSNVNLSRANLLFRVLRRRFQSVTGQTSSPNRVSLTNNTSESRSQSSDEGIDESQRNNYRLLLNNTNTINQRYSTTLIGVRSLFERIFQGQINFSRIMNSESVSLSSNTININNRNEDNNLTNSNDDFKELLRILSTCDSEYSDFRTYPIVIDWKEIEKGRSFAHEAMCAFGLLGASIYTSLNKLNNFAISYKKMPKEILEIYTELIKDNKGSKQYYKIKQYLEEFPKLDQIESILINSYISFKEYLLLFVILHLQFHFFSKLEINSSTQKKILELIEYFIENYLSDLDFISIIKSLLSQISFKKYYNEIKLDIEPLLNLKLVKQKIGYLNILITGSGGYLKEEMVL